MILKSDIQIRDPYVVLLDGKYYLYGTTDKDCWGPNAVGFDAYVSDDLEHFEGPYPIVRPEPGFWADRNFWAPEMHVYRGSYYLFASFKAEGVCRGTQIRKLRFGERMVISGNESKQGKASSVSFSFPRDIPARCSRSRCSVCPKRRFQCY